MHRDLPSADQPPEEKVTREQIDATRNELQTLRAPGLLIARGLALLGHCSLERVEGIEAGKGTLDAARDGIALASLFRDVDAVEPGLHPFNAARLATMERLGAWLIRNVTPTARRLLGFRPRRSPRAIARCSGTGCAWFTT